MIKKILTCVREYRITTFWVLIFMIGEVALDIILPYLMSRIIDVGITNSDLAYILKMGGAMVLLAMASLGFGIAAGRFSAVAATGFARNIRSRLFRQIQSFAFANVDHFSTPSLITRMTADVTNAQMAYMMTIRMAVRAPLMLIGSLIMAISINRELSAVILLAIPVLAVALYIIGRLAFPRFSAMMKKYDKMNGAVQETLIAIRTVKAFVRGDHENERFTEDASTLQKFQIRAEKVLIYNMPVLQFVMYASMIAVCWFGGNLIITGDMLAGEFMSFYSYVMMILSSLMMLSFVLIMLVLSRASIARIVEVFDELPAIDDSGADPDLTVQNGSVDFNDVSFSYSGDREKLHLSHVDLHIQAGETIGVIGGTGSAKTTLVQLIPRLYDVTDGEVLVGGRNVREYSLFNLRESVAMVLQNNVLFSGTIRDNLRWGNPEATDEEIADACRRACAHDFIMAFPDGYNTELGQGGVNVSGGQKQRLCIARALLKKPRILILDDSTSAVDTATDAAIRRVFREELTGVTTLIIAQRITSVMDCDRILVLDDGRLDDVGSHQELLARNEIYREVHDSQQKGVA